MIDMVPLSSKYLRIYFLITKIFSYQTILQLSRKLILCQTIFCRSYSDFTNCSNFLYNKVFFFRSPVIIPRLYVTFSCHAFIWDSFFVFLCLLWPDTLESYRLFCRVSQLGFVSCFLVIRSTLCIFGKNSMEVMRVFSLYATSRCMVYICSIADSVNSDHYKVIFHCH